MDYDIRFVVKGCGNCPFNKEENDGRVTEYHCNAPGSPQGRDASIDTNRDSYNGNTFTTPEWCPAKKGIGIRLAK